MLLVSLFQQPSHAEQPVAVRLFLESRTQLPSTALHTREGGTVHCQRFLSRCERLLAVPWHGLQC